MSHSLHAFSEGCARERVRDDGVGEDRWSASLKGWEMEEVCEDVFVSRCRRCDFVDLLNDNYISRAARERDNTIFL